MGTDHERVGAGAVGPGLRQSDALADRPRGHAPDSEDCGWHGFSAKRAHARSFHREERSAEMSAEQDLAYASIASVAELVRRKEISPVELTERTLARIEAIDPKINSFYTVFKEEAIAAARNAETEIRQGQYRGPLHGVPIGIKDIYQCGPTTCGSKSLKDYVADDDCTAVRKLKESGALVVGKNATYEFAYGFPTTKSYFKPARNPWNLAYDAGGSSSGSGSAVSAGTGFANMGSWH